MTELKPYPEYAKSGVEWAPLLPRSWKETRLRRVSSIYAGGTPDRANAEFWTDGTIPWLNSGSVNDDVIISPSELITAEAATGSSTRWAHPGSVLIALAGQGKTKGTAARLEISSTFNQSMAAIVPRDDTLDYRYLQFWLHSNYQSIRSLAGGDLRDGLNLQHIGGIQIPLPPIDEQVSVAEFLDRETAEIDAFIADQEELIGLLGERRASTISHAVTQGLDPTVPMKDSGVDWLGEVPESWRIQPLWSLFSRIKDVAHPEQPMLSVFRELGVVLKDDHDNLNKTAENRDIYQLVGPGWLVTNRMKAWQGSVGISPYTGIVSGHYICFAPAHSEFAPFLNYLFRSRPYAAGYSTLSRGVRIGQAEIDNDHYRLLPVVLPAVADQIAIADYLDNEIVELDAAIADAREAIALSKERRAALISAAVTGKIDVRGMG